MKKSFILFATSLLALAGCTRNQEIDIPEANLSLFARTESPTESKTVVESGVHVFWEPGDEIAVFMGEKSAKFTTDITTASGTATFKGTFGDTTWPGSIDLWAVYPFSEDAAFDGETITTTLPSEQIAREGSFGKDMNLSIAHSNSSTLQFYNVGGGIRFSVTEEGIKKVMFEGLSGEIISGKVKIGLEDGLPVVKEVTGGSQFITLLPPSGKETFEKDAWYYIVAIPGALEGGYKLRFYKDIDYARKVSEKAAVIKRSVFGNIEKADSGIEYEAQTTHFPETEEEWEESVETTYQVGAEVKSLLHPKDEHLQEVTDLILEEVHRIDGVLDVWVNPSKTAISVMQKDSIWINFNLDSYDIVDFEENGNSPVYQSSVSSINSSSNSRIITHQDTYILNRKRKALILDPFYESRFAKLEEVRTSLVQAGFNNDNIDIILDRQVSLEHFRGEFLSQYDVIIIHTHGGTGYNIYRDKKKPGIFDYTSGITTLATPIPYTKEQAASLISNNICTPDEIAIVELEDQNYPDLQYAFAITPRFIKDASFNDSCILLCACQSSELSREDDPGSMVWRFLNLGAAIVTGNKSTINRAINVPVISKILELVSYGVSFQEASTYIKNSSSTKQYCDNLYEYAHQMQPEDFPESEKFTFNFKNLFQLFENPSQQNVPYYLTYPIPKLQEVSVSESPVVLRWETPLSSFNTSWDFSFDPDGSYSFTDSYTVSYDVYVNGLLVKAGVTEKSISWTPNLCGDNTWYVVAKIKEEDTHIASYQSDEGHFTVTEEPHYSTPEAIDLGLSVKWASFNLGTSTPEKHGDYYAWGETEPYYSSQDPLIWEEGKEYGYDWDSYKWCKGREGTLTKYCQYWYDGYDGFTDDKTILDPEDDAAHVNLGSNWRMPTDAEWAELRNSCSWTWTLRNGVLGMLVSANNGNSIFLPADGYRDGTSLNSTGSYGCYWSSSLNDDYSVCAWSMCFNSREVGIEYNHRNSGLSVRPVYEDSSIIPVESVSLDKTEQELAIGKSSVLVATVLPQFATNKSVSWSSSNTSVATVSFSGVVTGVAAGTAIITVTTSDGGMTATCKVTVKETSSYNPIPEAIDLGLPSGTQWASFNLGAIKPEEYGDYYAWGETEPKDDYSWASYKWCMGEDNTMTKYCIQSEYGYNGFTDGKTILDPEDDAAHVSLGGNWRMPTDAEWTALIYNCTWTWMTLNGVTGFLVTAKNGNSIFLPAAGYRDGTSLDSAGSYGYYWSSSLNTSYSNHAWSLLFYTGVGRGSRIVRYHGQSIRPVYAE